MLGPGSELYGKAFEHWCFHELSAYNAYSESLAELSYWRLASGFEVDFIVNDMEVAIEAKSARKITSDHLRGLGQLKVDHPRILRRIVACLESKEYRTPDGIEIIPVRTFTDRLWRGDIY